MNRGIYISAQGMITETYRTDTIANNLANCNTVGYKKDINISMDFRNMLVERINDKEYPYPDVGPVGKGAVAWENYVVHKTGAYVDTGNNLNVAINGKGYFAVQTPAGVRYTRNGTFTLNNDGQLVTIDGYSVLGAGGGTINAIANQPISIGNNGRVFSGDQEIGQLEVVDVEDTRTMHKEDGVFFRMEEGAARAPFTGSIVSGMLEASNVNVVEEMVNLIASYRAYEINAKGVQTHDQLNDKAVNDVGKFG